MSMFFFLLSCRKRTKAFVSQLYFFLISEGITVGRMQLKTTTTPTLTLASSKIINNNKELGRKLTATSTKRNETSESGKHNTKRTVFEIQRYIYTQGTPGNAMQGKEEKRMERQVKSSQAKSARTDTSEACYFSKHTCVSVHCFWL